MLKRLLARNAGPRLSIVVVVYRMPEQAQKTLQSLALPYQQGVSETDYEVIVVENSSDQLLGKEAAEHQGENIRYFYREETQPTPVPAARFGVEQARAPFLGLMIDGARMATPGLVENVLKASLTHPCALVSIPGYHLGHEVQQEAIKSGYDATVEAQLLQRIRWPEDGYRLFDIACFSRSAGQGFFRPNAESNCLCLSRKTWDSLGGIDPRFTETGGGQANPDLYKRACEHADTELILIPGEGTFHQFHGGVTTGTPPAEREQHMHNHFEQYKALRGSYYHPPTTEPRLYGQVPAAAMRFLRRSVNRAIAATENQGGGS